jgi:hypothetical protein
MELSGKADAEAAMKMSLMISAVLPYLNCKMEGGPDNEPE